MKYQLKLELSAAVPHTIKHEMGDDIEISLSCVNKEKSVAFNIIDKTNDTVDIEVPVTGLYNVTIESDYKNIIII
jgi:hypothetical protein